MMDFHNNTPSNAVDGYEDLYVPVSDLTSTPISEPLTIDLNFFRFLQSNDKLIVAWEKKFRKKCTTYALLEETKIG